MDVEKRKSVSLDRTPPPLKIVESTSSSSQSQPIAVAASQSQSIVVATAEPDDDALFVLDRVLDDVAMSADVPDSSNVEEEDVGGAMDAAVQKPEKEKPKKRKKTVKTFPVELPFEEREFPQPDRRKRCNPSPTQLSQSDVDEILQSYEKAPLRMDEEDVIDEVAAVRIFV